MNTVHERLCTWSEHCSAPRSLMSLGLKTPVSVGSPSLQPAPARKGGRCGSKAKGGLQVSPPCLLPFLLSPFLYSLLLETLSNCEDRETPDSRAEGDLGWTFLPPPPPFLCEVFWVSSAAQKKSSVGGLREGMFTRKQSNPYPGKRRCEKPKTLGKASLFICWIGGQLSVQQTISFTTQWQSGGFTEAIPAGKQNQPHQRKKASRSQACIIEVSPIKEASEAPGSQGAPIAGAEVEL